MNTVPLPFCAVHVFGPQHAAWMPVSSTRSDGRVWVSTLGEPVIAGPTAGCGHAGQPCASAGTFDLSPSLPCGGMGLLDESAGGHGADAADDRADRDVRRGEGRDRPGAEDVGDHRRDLPD